MESVTYRDRACATNHEGGAEMGIFILRRNHEVSTYCWWRGVGGWEGDGRVSDKMGSVDNLGPTKRVHLILRIRPQLKLCVMNWEGGGRAL